MPSNTRSLPCSFAASLVLPLGAAHAGPVPGQGTWQSTLQPRDISVDGTVDAFYDTVLNVSWLADGSVVAVSVHDSKEIYSTATDGLMNWPDAQAWAASLNVFGTTGWRLPSMIDTRERGCEFSYSGTDCGYNVQTISADGQTVYSEKEPGP